MTSPIGIMLLGLDRTHPLNFILSPSKHDNRMFEWDTFVESARDLVSHHSTKIDKTLSLIT